MPVTPTYPGVYVEEIPSGVRTITGVSTSVTAFIGYFNKGPINEPVQLFNLGDFEREFGGLDSISEASYGIQQFFLNGGSEAWAVRTASGGVASSDVAILDGVGGGAATVLTVTAINPGTWGDQLRVTIDYPEPTSNNTFNMTVSLLETRDGEQVVVRSEVFRGLNMTAGDLKFVDTVVNDEFSGSNLVRVVAGGGGNRPQPNGTLSGDLSAFPVMTTDPPQLNVSIGTEGPHIATMSAQPTTLSEARGLLESAIRAASPESKAYSQARVSVVDDRLRVLAGPTDSSSLISFSTIGVDPTAADLGLTAGTNVDGVLSGDVTGWPPAMGDVDVSINGAAAVTLTLDDAAIGGGGGGVLNNTDELRSALENLLQVVEPSAVVALYDDIGAGTQHLVVIVDAGVSVVFADAGPDTTATVLGLAGGEVITGAYRSADIPAGTVINAAGAVNVSVGASGTQTATIGAMANNLAGYATELETAIRGASTNSAFTDARVAPYTDGVVNQLIAIGGNPLGLVVFSDAPADPSATELQLDVAVIGMQANVQLYALGSAVVVAAQGPATAGNNGTPPDGLALIGDLAGKTGIYALEDVDIFNILAIPRTASKTGANALSDAEAGAVMTAAINYCEQRRAFFIMDTPTGVDEVTEIKDWLDANATLRHKNAALYFPRVHIPDPLDDFRLRSVGASGTMAGLYARTDGTRGVWKAPAGTEATLSNVSQFDYLLTDDQNGTLNPLAINCLRSFPVYGNISWGARTLVGADQMGSEWKYVPVRRVALFIEESLYRGTKWVVFEPNDEPLWSQIRLNVTAFMHRLFSQGAFQGQSPGEAYLVKCDSETTPQADIDLGIVNIIVGFAPLKPAEFVIIKISQLTKSAEV